jgi:hypothetical protein
VWRRAEKASGVFTPSTSGGGLGWGQLSNEKINSKKSELLTQVIRGFWLFLHLKIALFIQKIPV